VTIFSPSCFSSASNGQSLNCDGLNLRMNGELEVFSQNMTDHFDIHSRHEIGLTIYGPGHLQFLSWKAFGEDIETVRVEPFRFADQSVIVGNVVCQFDESMQRPTMQFNLTAWQKPVGLLCRSWLRRPDFRDFEFAWNGVFNSFAVCSAVSPDGAASTRYLVW
jgi:hypothetical protein